MDVSEENIKRALKLAHDQHWEDGLPRVNAQLRLAINSLKAQQRGSLPRNPDELTALIKLPKNKKVRRIICENSLEAFAFAIRDSLR